MSFTICSSSTARHRGNTATRHMSNKLIVYVYVFNGRWQDKLAIQIREKEFGVIIMKLKVNVVMK